MLPISLLKLKCGFSARKTFVYQCLVQQVHPISDASNLGELPDLYSGSNVRASGILRGVFVSILSEEKGKTHRQWDVHHPRILGLESYLSLSRMQTKTSGGAHAIESL